MVQYTVWLQIQQRIVLKYSRNFRGLSTYRFAHAKFKKSCFSPKILQFEGDIDIISNHFYSLFYSTIKIGVKFIWDENYKIPGIHPI